MRLPSTGSGSFWLSVILLFLLQSFTCLSSELDTIRSRVVAELLKSEISEQQVKNILNRMNPDGSFPEIDYQDLSRTAGFPHRKHTGDLVYLAKAYSKASSAFYQDQALKEKITLSLKYWVNHDFVGDNWHNNQITTPTNLVNLMLLMGDELPEDLVDKAQPIIGRAHMEASGARPSGDRIVIAGILAKNLLFTRNKEAFDEVISIIANEIKFSTGERGIQHDYSFHHRVDRVNNTTSYGYGKYANAFGEWADYVAGTSYAFDTDRINQLVDYYLDGVYKQLVYGIYEDISVKNRAISNQTTFQPKGTEEIERLLRSTDHRKEELEEIIQLRKGERSPTRSFAKFFWQTEHFVLQRPDFYTTVRMFSTRNRNMEMPYNGPGITTHHRADGTNYLMLKGNEYHDIWPVYDWQKISGTTILQKPELHGPDDIQMDGLTDFVGAAEDGYFGTVGFDFISPHDDTKAKKAWFFFDRVYVCLGAGIASDKPHPVATTVDQVLLRGPIRVQQRDSDPRVLPEGEHELEDLEWLYHDGVGYWFPNRPNLTVKNQVESGSWADITDQKNVSTKEIRKKVLTAYFDHGIRPQDAGYAYLVAPRINLEELASLPQSGLTILANNQRLQAVHHPGLEQTQAVFYEAGTLYLTDGAEVAVKQPGIVLIKNDGNSIQSLTVADPGRSNSEFKISVPGKYKPRSKAVKATWNRSTNTSLITMQMPDGVYAGQSLTVELRPGK
ncbi:polysaccharide lyase family 8 super-sandwich domain-containing protein [Cyclobacterium sp. SYSU L10401]|uniref:polysaccharide lyase family 8 super-sandwich domain-containing protein n=1 Tax=Cyclobacterium sp. SYSU L10401 TaxID=2678657 RepID=UPI0013D14D5B|nr:polysaccharide lyase family 8 super-sandwich domain-containing protein [Cyclobacterium sp. SYSU L10401]